MRPTPGSRLVQTLAALVLPLAGAAIPAPAPGHAAPAAAEQPPGRQRFLLVSADRQSVDTQLGKLIAEGRVQARFDGWLLLADRVEVLEATRTVYASGRIRLIRGDQKLQASRLRYSEFEGRGELEDVYGVIDQETLEQQITAATGASGTNAGEPVSEPANRPDAESAREPAGDLPAASAQPSSPASAEAEAEAEELAFACPDLVSDPQRRSVLELVPPRRVPLPTLPAPAGCPGAEAGSRPRPLRELLVDVALGPPPGEDGAATSPEQTRQPVAEIDPGTRPIPQRVRDVRFRQGVDTAVRFDLVDINDEDDQDSPSGRPTGPSVLRRPKPQSGRLNRLRFQASRVTMAGNRWSAREVALTNDPFTPARSWLIGYGVEAQLEENGVTRLRAQRTRILLSNRLSLRGINTTTVGEEGPQFSIDADRRDRDGIYLGYNLPPLRLGAKGRLDLQPQFMLQRAIEGSTDSYTKPGRNLAGPRVNQTISLGDAFGLVGVLDTPIDRFRLRARADLSTLNPDNIRAGTRSRGTFDTPIPLPGHEAARAGAFASYRERIFNGSLGRQTVITSYGVQVEGSLTFNRQEGDRIDRERRTPYLAPVRLDWSAISGSYRAELFNTNNLETQWRTRLNGNLSSSLQLWEAPLDPQRRELAGLRYSPVPVRPGLALDFGLVGSGGFYQDGERQNTLTVYGGPALTLGRFRDPWFDFTQLTVLVGGTLRDGVSPFSFDRAVDLRTVSFRAAQQLYGPLVLEAGATVNIDQNSRFSGDVSSSYVELRLEQRSYALGIFYSPYEGTGGIRVTLNDFNFGGSGTPFVPRPAPAAATPLSESR